tara:strand:+ start:210 stop:428 length:219 start_codon:yes stop_codon:yes gene_type:complete
MKKIKTEFNFNQSEFFNLVDRIKERASIRDCFYIKQLQDEISDLKHKEKFWSKKYFNLKREMGLFFPTDSRR